MKKAVLILLATIALGCGGDDLTSPTSEMPWLGTYAGFVSRCDPICWEMNMRATFRNNWTCSFSGDYTEQTGPNSTHRWTFRSRECTYRHLASTAGRPEMLDMDAEVIDNHDYVEHIYAGFWNGGDWDKIFFEGDFMLRRQ